MTDQQIISKYTETRVSFNGKEIDIMPIVVKGEVYLGDTLIVRYDCTKGRVEVVLKSTDEVLQVQNLTKSEEKEDVTSAVDTFVVSTEFLPQLVSSCSTARGKREVMDTFIKELKNVNNGVMPMFNGCGPVIYDHGYCHIYKDHITKPRVQVWLEFKSIVCA
tara:strand:+ start:61 stop:546 length:486 start_codon:yes stop_codon:yes gene_type:complete